MSEAPMTPVEIKRLLEAALLASAEALSIARLRQMFDESYGTELLRRCLEELQADWRGRGVQLVQVAEGWRFQTAAEMQPWLERLNPVTAPRYSRAVLETLTIIAYRQPVTRGDVEEIRGVAVSTPVIRTLEERGWIEVIGHRDVPGRPGLYATTRRFLSDLGLRSLAELPPLPEIGSTPVTLPLLDVENEESDAVH
ncbi:MAG: SMC-Scp complex subunit ScpB [Betaproteobacteria bacterium]|nr:SMC-Scp complex subunit ScpB [Betaproteobacteria bacterium]